MQAALAHNGYACMFVSLTHTLPNTWQDLTREMQPTLAHNIYSCVSLSHTHTAKPIAGSDMGWLRLVGSLQL